MVTKKKPGDSKKPGGTVKVKWVVSFISCTDDMPRPFVGWGCADYIRLWSARIRRQCAA